MKMMFEIFHGDKYLQPEFVPVRQRCCGSAAKTKLKSRYYDDPQLPRQKKNSYTRTKNSRQNQNHNGSSFAEIIFLSVCGGFW